MSKLTGPTYWNCDSCCKNGGIVDEHETLPYRWMSLRVLVGTPQIAKEQRTDRLVHLCSTCGQHWLFNVLQKNSDIERLRAIFNRSDKP